MKETRWLLPFTRGVNIRAIDQVFRLAEHCGATLVAASLIILPDPQEGQGVLITRLRQSKDFLEIVKVKAAQYHILVEPHEVWTSDAQDRMKRLVVDLQCDSVVLVTEGGDGVLLSAHEMEDILMGCTQASLMLVRLQASSKGTITAYLRRLFFSWVSKHWKQHRVADGSHRIRVRKRERQWVVLFLHNSALSLISNRKSFIFIIWCPKRLLMIYM